MADKNVTPMAESKNKKTKKQPMSVKQILTTIIIVILALLMVGGFFYIFSLISQSKAEKASAWGSYDGKDIRLEPNNVFYNTLVSDQNLMNAQLSGDYNTMLNSYYGAYQSQVLYEAISQEAKDAGILAPQELVNRLILRAGIYNDADGNFSEEIFDQATESEKMNVSTFYTNYYPYTVALTDLQSTIVSTQEKDFVVQMSKDTRTFDYFIVNYNVYPNELATTYGQDNSKLFSRANLSTISASTEEKITEAYQALTTGATWDDVLTNYTEGSTTDSGSIGEVQLQTIISNLANPDDIDIITALEVGAYSAPIQNTTGYTIYKLDSAVSEPDFTDAETLSSVKKYIADNGIDDITPFVDSALATATIQAQEDFAATAAAVNSEIISVPSVNDNIGQSIFLTGISTYDTTGYLAAAATDEAISRELFTADTGYVTGPMAVSETENTYIIAKVTDTNTNNEGTSYGTSVLYDYYAGQQPGYDAFANILISDKHQDNFYTQFFNMLFSSAT